MATTSASDALRHALQLEYLKLYLTLSVGLWLLFDGGRTVFEAVEQLVRPGVLRNVVQLLSTLTTFLGLVLVIASVVAIAYRVKEA